MAPLDWFRSPEGSPKKGGTVRVTGHDVLQWAMCNAVQQREGTTLFPFIGTYEVPGTRMHDRRSYTCGKRTDTLILQMTKACISS